MPQLRGKTFGHKRAISTAHRKRRMSIISARGIAAGSLRLAAPGKHTAADGHAPTRELAACRPSAASDDWWGQLHDKLDASGPLIVHAELGHSKLHMCRFQPMYACRNAAANSRVAKCIEAARLGLRRCARTGEQPKAASAAMGWCATAAQANRPPPPANNAVLDGCMVAYVPWRWSARRRARLQKTVAAWPATRGGCRPAKEVRRGGGMEGVVVRRWQGATPARDMPAGRERAHRHPARAHGSTGHPTTRSRTHTRTCSQWPAFGSTCSRSRPTASPSCTSAACHAACASSSRCSIAGGHLRGGAGAE